MALDRWFADVTARPVVRASLRANALIRSLAIPRR